MKLYQQVLGVLFILGCTAFMVVFVIGSLIYLYFMPTILSKKSFSTNNDHGLTLLDDSGKPFFSFYNATNKEYVDLQNISPFIKSAAVASEDEEFYHHFGFSAKGIVRSIIKNIQTGSLSYGGSTITQQLIKNTLLSPDRNILRKFTEIVLAVEVERYYSKQQILEMYLNTAYFGKNAFGIEKAAETYFGKKADNLNLSESAYVVGLLTSPTYLSENQDLAIKRKNEVLARMRHDNMISDSEMSDAMSQTLKFASMPNQLNEIAPHFALLIRDQLIDKYGEQKVISSGFKVKTTLNRTWQEEAESAVSNQINNIRFDGASNGSVVVINPHNGHVKVMVGSVGWENTDFGRVNMATTPRQPGSSFKPIVYAIAFQDEIITPATILSDVPTVFKSEPCYTQCEYKPHDYDGKFRGPVTARRALSNSLNIPAVEVMQKVGIEKVLTTAQKLGITSLGSDTSKYGLSMVLGAGEVSLLQMTSAYSSFANNGSVVTPVLFTQITEKNGNVIYTNTTPESNYVWDSDTAYLINSILSDNRSRQEEFGNTLYTPIAAAVKTGTSEDYRDAWTIGYTPDLVVGVWVGNNNNRPMDNIAGSLGAAPVFRTLITDYSQSLSKVTFEKPGGIVKVPTCFSSSDQASSSARMYYEYFISGTEPEGCFRIPNEMQATTSAQLSVMQDSQNQANLPN